MNSRQSVMIAVAALMVCVLSSSGCSDGGSAYRITGTVTFKGQPIPEGRIYFLPDNTKGNTGAGGFAEIKNGKYDTSAPNGRGSVGGPMKVAIEGWDPSGEVKGDDPEVTVASLFHRYETEVDMPKESTSKDFDVPAEAAKRKPESSQPRPAYEP